MALEDAPITKPLATVTVTKDVDTCADSHRCQPPPKRKQREKQDPHVRAEDEAPLLRPRFQALRRLHDEGVVSAPDVCVAYIVAYLQVRLPGRWLIERRKTPQTLSSEDDVWIGQCHPSIQLTDPRLAAVIDPFTDRDWGKLKFAKDADATLRDLIEVARFNQIPEHVAPCLFNFYAGRRPLVLLWRVPSSRELLEMQAAGQRCVSALMSERALRTMYGHRGCLEMLVHDLSHMECLVEAGRYWQQIGYFEFLRASVAPVHESRWSAAYGERWRLSWHYVSADMNAVANHMLQTLKWQLAVAVARATLHAAGLSRPGDDAEDAALSNQHADVYPRASLADWEPTLRDVGLLETFEENFIAEWHNLLSAHVSDVSARFPDIFPAHEVMPNAEELGQHFATWPRPSAETFLAAAGHEAGRGAARLDPALRAHQAAVTMAHFDELGRRHLLCISTKSSSLLNKQGMAKNGNSGFQVPSTALPSTDLSASEMCTLLAYYASPLTQDSCKL